MSPSLILIKYKQSLPSLYNKHCIRFIFYGRYTPPTDYFYLSRICNWYQWRMILLLHQFNVIWFQAAKFLVSSFFDAISISRECVHVRVIHWIWKPRLLSPWRPLFLGWPFRSCACWAHELKGDIPSMQDDFDLMISSLAWTSFYNGIIRFYIYRYVFKFDLCEMWLDRCAPSIFIKRSESIQTYYFLALT